MTGTPKDYSRDQRNLKREWPELETSLRESIRSVSMQGSGGFLPGLVDLIRQGWLIRVSEQLGNIPEVDQSGDPGFRKQKLEAAARMARIGVMWEELQKELEAGMEMN